MAAAKPDFKAYQYNTVHIRDGKFFAVAMNTAGKIEDEVEFASQAEAEEFTRKSMTYA